MTNKDFYDKINSINTGNSRLDVYYEALHELIEAYQFSFLTWEALVEILSMAGQIVTHKPINILSLNKNTFISDEEMDDVNKLKRFLKEEISYIQKNGIPQDSYFNWHISIILERGVTWMMMEGDDDVFELTGYPTWATLLLIIEMGREYE
ncbi:hypothetical protein AD998_08565 [bacterium 336/3]|nr:hypothetical protein AD998_08565 [bacterium 336/3]